jgi:hypothetical protein
LLCLYEGIFELIFLSRRIPIAGVLEYLGMGDFEAIKERDPFIFQKAEHFFRDVDGLTTPVSQPASVSYLKADQLLEDGGDNPACSHGAVFRFNDDSLLLIQFMRPRVWRIRFHPGNNKGSDFSDYNT